MPDKQIHPIGTETAPAEYKIPSAAELLLKSVHARYNGSGAAGDFVPLVRIISNGGSTTDEIPQDATIAAGASADATWFPHVGGAAAAAGVTGVASGMYQGSASPVTLTSGVAQTITWDPIANAPGSFPIISNAPFGVSTFNVTAWRVHVDFKVAFPSGNYDRYIEINQTPGVGNVDLPSPVRVRSQATPDGDTLTASCVAGGNPFSASNLNLVAYQASGVNQSVSCYCWLIGWPIALPSEAWS